MEILQTPVGLLLVGAAAGIASGLFGIGGGLIIIPIFTALMKMNPHRASATSIAIVVLPVALPAVIKYHRAGIIDWRIVLWVALGFVISNVFGANLNLSMNDQVLRRVFAVFLILAAIQLWMKPAKNGASTNQPTHVTASDKANT